MFRILAVIAAVVIVAATAHGVVAGQEGAPPLTAGSTVMGVLLVALVAFWLGRKFAQTSAMATATARAEATAAAKSRASAVANQAVQINVSPTGQVSGSDAIVGLEYGRSVIEDSYGEDLELIEDSGDDVVVPESVQSERF